MQRLSIIRWQQTQGKYVALLQMPDRFKANSLKPRDMGQGAVILEGEVVGTGEKDWYCVSLPREEMEFDEAREMAKALVDAENLRRAGPRRSIYG